MTIQGNIIDVLKKNIYYGEIQIEGGVITKIRPMEGECKSYILPGFVDAHIHIESSMLVPSEFARLAVLHGTVATVSDPHEIANVMGMEGVLYMIANGNQVPFKFNFGAPSCVPATTFETAGATLGLDEVKKLLERPDIRYLSEMMNYPGVLFNDEEVMAKLAVAKKLGKPIDGHAPGLRGEDARKYIAAGINTDHECFTYDEAREKLEYGMKVIIREGSAAKNFEALIDLLPEYKDQMMFCSDDKHPDDLVLGHINQLVSRAIKKGCSLFDVLQVACVNPVKHYNLEVGLLQVGDPADFIITDDLESFKVKATYINGQQVAENGMAFLPEVEASVINNFNTDFKKPEDFAVDSSGDKIRVIRALDGEIVTEQFTAPVKVENRQLIPDIDQDILKITVVNRYENAPPSVAFINGFGLKEGAVASCVGHDSHNIIAVGVDDEAICKAVNLIIENKGGISAVDQNGNSEVLPLPVAGIMTNADAYEVAKAYEKVDQFAKSRLKTCLSAPFMTLSFMALLVIPDLKLSDKGLFDGKAFQFVSLME